MMVGFNSWKDEPIPQTCGCNSCRPIYLVTIEHDRPYHINRRIFRDKSKVVELLNHLGFSYEKLSDELGFLFYGYGDGKDVYVYAIKPE